MHKLLVVTLVCLFVIATARVVPNGEFALERLTKDVETKLDLQPAVSEKRKRAKRSFYFRGYWSCPIGYIRSPAFNCMECDKYTMITGKHCD